MKYEIYDCCGEIMARGNTQDEAFQNCALELAISPQEVSEAIFACRNGYQGEDSLFMREIQN